VRENSWLYRLLDRGTVPDPDPDEPVAAGEVPFIDGPMVVTLLGRAGIRASLVENAQIRTHRLSTILVRRDDVEAARAFADEAGFPLV
jgi:hypothetical protein